MDQYIRKTQRTRVFNPAPKAPIAIATGAIPPKPCTGLKRKFDEDLDAKLEEYLARKAGCKKPKFDDKVQQLIKKANAGNVQSCVKAGNSSTFATAMNGVPKKIDCPQKQLTNFKISSNPKSSTKDVPHMPQKASNKILDNLLSNCRESNRISTYQKDILASSVICKGNTASRKDASKTICNNFATALKDVSRKDDQSATSIKGQGASRKEQPRGNAHNSSKKEEGVGRGKHGPALHGANHVTNNRGVDKRAKQEGSKSRHHSSENRHSSTKHKTSAERESMKESIVEKSRSQKAGMDNNTSQQKSSHSDVAERKRHHPELNSSAKKDCDKNSFASALGNIARKVDQVKESTKCQDPSRREKDQRKQTTVTDGDSSSARIAKRAKADSSRKRSSDSDPPPSDKSKMDVRREFANKLSQNLPSQGNRPDSFGATVNDSSKVSSETRSNVESIPKSPRKVIVIDIPTAVSQKRIIIKGNRTDQQGKMTVPKNGKAEKKGECVKPAKTKPTKSLRERLASRGKFTFSTATHSNPVRKNMAIIKERLAQLTQNKKAAEIVARDQENNIIWKNQEALNNNHMSANNGEQRQLKDEPRRLRDELPQLVENKDYPPQRNVEVASSVTSTVMDKLHISNEESSLLPGSKNSSSSGSDESSSSDSGDSSSDDDSASSDDVSDSSSSEDEEEYDNNEKLGQMLEEKIGGCPKDDEVFRGQLATNDLCQDLDLSCSFSEEET